MELNSGIVEEPFQTELNSVWNSGIDLIFALKYAFFQLCSSAKQIAVRLARFKRSYVKGTTVILTSHASFIAFLLVVCCVAQSGQVSFLQLFVPDDSVFG